MPEESVSIIAVLKDQFTAVSEKVRSHLEGLGTAVEKLKGKLEPLNGTAERFLAGFAFVELIRKSIEAAREAEGANVRLMTSLEGDKDALQSVSKAVEEYGVKTGHSAAEVKGLAAQLHNSGVAAGDLPQMLKLAIDISAKFGGSIEQVGSQLSLVYEGKVPRAIGSSRALGTEMQRMQREGRGTGAILEELGRKSEGAAEKIAKGNVFTQARIQQIRLEESTEKLGKVFVSLESVILPKVADAMEKFMGLLQSDAGQKGVTVAQNIASSIATILPWVIKVYIAWQVWNVVTYAASVAWAVLTVAVAAFEVVFSPVGLAIAAAVITLGAIAVGIVLLVKHLHLLDDVFNGLGTRVARAFNAMLHGKITAKEAFDAIIAEAEALVIQLYSRLFEPVKLTLSSLWTWIASTANLGLENVKFLALTAIKFILDELGSALTKAAEMFDSANAKFANALNLVSAGSGEILRTHLAANISIIKGVLDPAIDESNRRAKELERTIDGVWKNLPARIAAARQLGDALAASMRAGAVKGEPEEKPGEDAHTKQSRDEAAAEAEARAYQQSKQQLLEATRKLEEDRKNIILRSEGELRAEQVKIELFELERAHRSGLLSEREYIEKKVALETEGMKKQIDLLESDISKERERQKTLSAGSIAYRDSLERENDLLKQQGLLKAQVELKQRELTESTETYGSLLKSTLSSGINSVFGDLEKGVTKGKQLWRDFATSTLKTLGEMAEKILENQIITMIIKGIGGATGGASGGFFTTSIPGHAAGGAVRGPGQGDSVLIRATPGEHVIQKSAVNYYGAPMIAAINDMVMPRSTVAGFSSSPSRGHSSFARGGEVSSASQSGAFAVQRATVVSDEQSFDRMLAGGHPALVRHLRSNKDEINRALGK